MTDYRRRGGQEPRNAPSPPPRGHSGPTVPPPGSGGFHGQEKEHPKGGFAISSEAHPKPFVIHFGGPNVWSIFVIRQDLPIVSCIGSYRRRWRAHLHARAMIKRGLKGTVIVARWLEQ